MYVPFLHVEMVTGPPTAPQTLKNPLRTYDSQKLRSFVFFNFIGIEERLDLDLLIH